jgi:hypothetical protein
LKRLSLVLLALLVSCSAGTKPVATKPVEGGTVGGPDPRPPSQRHHYDMANYGGTSSTCDYGNLTVKRLIEETVEKQSAYYEAVRARILKIGAPRWNSPSGKRPTQAEADAIVEGPLDSDLHEPKPSIYRPVTVQVEKVYSGSTRGTVTLWAETGRIGNDFVTSCAFGSFDRLLVRGGPHVATVGESYVMFLAHRVIGPVIDDLFFIQEGSLVVGPYEKLEPLP